MAERPKYSWLIVVIEILLLITGILGMLIKLMSWPNADIMISAGFGSLTAIHLLVWPMLKWPNATRYSILFKNVVSIALVLYLVTIPTFLVTQLQGSEVLSGIGQALIILLFIVTMASYITGKWIQSAIVSWAMWRLGIPVAIWAFFWFKSFYLQ